jgi:two-component system, NarL family, invasion response regulator UvrY
MVTRVFIADDHAVVRKGLRQVVAEAADMEICGEAEDYPQIMHGLRQTEVDVLLLDIGLPTKNGI